MRVAVVAEGPTDVIVIEAALRAVFTVRPFVLTMLQPEGSIAFGARGGGWGGVYRWCKQSSRRGKGRLGTDHLVLGSFDALIIHADADVAGQEYSDSNIEADSADGPLPCERPCPPARDTTDALRSVLLTWCGEGEVPPNVVLCVPSKSTEAWVVAALFFDDAAVVARKPFECFANPESRLSLQPKKQRIKKSQSDYRSRSDSIQAGWPRVAARLKEAYRFQSEILDAIQEASANG